MVGIGWYFLVFTIRKPTENLVGIKMFAGTPYFHKRKTMAPISLKRGAMAPFLRSPAPLLREKSGEQYKKGGMIPTENTKYKANLIPVNTDTKKIL